jgi:hypothetical protein
VRHILTLIYLIKKYLPRFLVLHFLGNAGLLTSLRVVGPLLGKEQTVVDQGVTVTAAIPQKDSNLAVIDLTQPAAVLAFDAARVIPFLGETRAITKEDAIGVIPDLTDVLAEFTEDRLVLPRRNAQEVLEDFATHPLGVSDGLCGLPGKRRQFAIEEVLRVGALLGTLE